MRLVKALLFTAIVVSLLLMWSGRAPVIGAYETADLTSLQVRLSGVDLAVARTEIDPSPYAIPAAPDTRRRPLPARTIDDEPASSITEVAPVVLAGGTSRLQGVVIGPDGPAAGATVRIEHHSTHGTASVDVFTDTEGRWLADGLAGGRYRIRAWVPGLMTMGRSEVAFVAEDDTVDFTFSLFAVDPIPTLELVTGGAIYDGLTGTVALSATSRSVDADGIVVTTALPTLPVSVVVSSGMIVESNPLQYTDATGAARFILRCPPSGQSQHGTLTARSGDLVVAFALPRCQPVPAPPPPDPPTGAPDTVPPAADASTVETSSAVDG